jgi:hypothetical protein
MKVRALIGFVGLVSMRKNEVKDIRDKKIVTDLIRAGYVEPIDEKTDKQKEEASS